jgi:hypothetical protein
MNHISAGVSAESDARRKEVSEGRNGSCIEGQRNGDFEPAE